jgi:hypothetical protein
MSHEQQIKDPCIWAPEETPIY